MSTGTSPRERFAAFRRTQPRAPRLTRRTVTARGLSFAVFTSPQVSNAPPLVCVNGGMLYSHALLWPALSPLAAARPLVLYDQRGRGASEAPADIGDARIEQDAGDLVALREALGFARWDVLGHSWGGGISMLAAARDTLGVRRLVLVDAVGPTGDWIPSLHPDALGRLDGAARETLAALEPALLHQPDPVVHAEYSRAIYPAWFSDRGFAALFAPPHEASATGATIAARLRREGYDWTAEIRRVTARTLIIHGEDDLMPRRAAEANAQLIPHSRLSFIAAAGHMPFWERPVEFFARTRAFLDEPDAGA